MNDIFSKQKAKKTQQLPTITIDYRDKNSLVPAKLISLGHKIIFQELKVGDFLINGTIIERKEIKDFAQSIKNKRVWKQVEEIKQYPNYFLIIEGNIYSQTSLHENAIKGSILSILLNYKVPILFSNSPEETAQYISLLSKKEKKKKQVFTPTKKQFSKESWQLNILQSFPDIGEKKSIKLLEGFTTLKNIFNSSTKRLYPILGKKTDEFISIIEKAYK